MEKSFKDDHGLIQASREPTFFTIGRPRDHKAKVCIWADLTVNDLDVLRECCSAEHLRQVLARRFALSEQNCVHRILLDLYLATVQFARDQQFSPEQTSAFFSIVKRTHEVAVETPFGNVDQTFSFFREQVLCHAVHRPPFSLGLFSAEAVQTIMTYVLDTYFRHFKLYKYAFTPQVRLDLSISYEGMPPETPPPAEEEAADGEPGDDVTGGGTDRSGISEPAEGSPTAGTETAPPVEESAAMRQLRDLVRTHVSAELKSLRLEVDERLKATEAQLTDRLAVGEGGGRRSAKGSAKGRRK